MLAQLLDGKKLAEEIGQKLKEKSSSFKSTTGRAPTLATVLVGNHSPSQVYVRSKIKACASLGIISMEHQLPESVSQEKLEALVHQLSRNPQVDGILLQIPLPPSLKPDLILEFLAPEKDVDGSTPANLGRLYSLKSWQEIEQSPVFVPCTPLGIVRLLQKTEKNLSGARAVVLGRSNIVGKPMMFLLSALDATVTLCHSQTKNLEETCSQAEVLISAIGKARFVRPAMVAEGAVVIDVGIGRDEDNQFCGDVDTPSVSAKASWITPVPGGVGPMTVIMLMRNTILSAYRRLRLNSSDFKKI